MTIFIAHAEADRAVAESLERHLERRGQFVELETGEMPFRPLQTMDAVVLLVSKDSVFSPWRLRWEKRALDAWADGKLVVVKLDHAFSPVGLRDLPAIDASFEAQRDFTWAKVADALREALSPKPPGGGEGAQSDRAPPPAAAAPAPQAPPTRAPAPARKAASGGRAAPFLAVLALIAVAAAVFLWPRNPSAPVTVAPPPGVSASALAPQLDAARSRLAVAEQALTDMQARTAPAATEAELAMARAARDAAAERVAALEARMRAAQAPPTTVESAPPETHSPLPVILLAGGGVALLAAIGLWVAQARRRAAPAETVAAKPTPAEPPAPPLPAPPTSGAANLFVSYASADRPRVAPIVEGVQQNGQSVWIDQQGITAGEGWAGEIVRAIKGAKSVLIMCSAAAFESDHVKREIYLADRYKKRLLPVFLEDAPPPEDFEYFFAGVQWLKLHETPETDRPQAIVKALAAA